MGETQDYGFQGLVIQSNQMYNQPILDSVAVRYMSKIFAIASSRNATKATPAGPRAWVNGLTAAWLVVPAAAFHGSATGAGWRAVRLISGDPLSSVVVDGRGAVYANAASGVFKSSDSGETWVSVTSDLPVPSLLQAIAADPVNPGTLYAGTNRAMLRTVNGGSHWTTLTIPNATSIEGTPPHARWVITCGTPPFALPLEKVLS
jgi:photosystem II stability/assembly factor-like uncharacterized protein